jgi:glycosyltransferase involved in cell wall biosynthesis
MSASNNATKQKNDLSVVAIIPLYNGARWIEAAIKSVLDQTVPPNEFIIVDDGSTDDGPAIVERIAKEHPRTRLLRKPNGGQSSARNFGVAQSTSRLIALLDQDDVWYANHLEKLMEPFQHSTNGVPLGWVYGNLDEVDENGLLVRRSVLDTVPATHPKRVLVDCLRHDMFVLPSASLISREAFLAVGGFDDRLSGYEDDDLFLRLFRAGFDNVYINESLTRWRLFAGSTSYTDRMARSRLIYAQKLIDAYPDDKYRHRQYANDFIAPRFVRSIIFDDLVRAIRYDNSDLANRSLDDLKQLLPYLRWQKRTMLAVTIPLMRNLTLAKTSLVVAKWARRALRRTISNGV